MTNIQKKVEETLSEQQVDYTAERDDRVIPVIKKFLGALGNFSFNFNRTKTPEAAKEERESFASFVQTQFIPLAFEHKLQQNDLNYTFQLAGTVVEMLRNRSLIPLDETDPRISDCALAILKDLGAADTLRIRFADDEVDPKKSSELRAELYYGFYNAVVLPAFERYQIKPNEMNHVFEVMAGLIKETGEKVMTTVADARSVAEAKMWGVDNIETIDILTIHKKVVEEEPTLGVY